MRKPGRLLLQLLWLASFAACASARPVLEMRPINDGMFNARWPEVLRTRYQCDDAVVGPALAAVRSGFLLVSRFPIDSDRGSLVCDLGGLSWPVRVRAFETDSGIVEQWEFQPTQGQQGHPGTTANIYGPNPAQGRAAISRNIYQTYSMFLKGPTPHLLRVVRFGT